MHAISSYHGNILTNKQTQSHTHRQDRLQYTAPQLASAQCKNSNVEKQKQKNETKNQNPENQKLGSTVAPLPWDGCVANPWKQALSSCVNKR